MEVNGVAPTSATIKLGGASSSGEFGSVMKGIFAPEHRDRFHLASLVHAARPKMHVYAYHVAAANSDYHIVVPGKPRTW